MSGPVINDTAVERIAAYAAIGRNEADLVVGGEPAREGSLGKGSFFQPTIFTEVKPDARIAQEEIFGPVTSVIPVDDWDETVRIVNSVKYGLSTSLFTRDINLAFRSIRDFDSGLGYVNHGTIGAEAHLPFGGTKATGNGHREVGQAALDFFSEWKSVYIDYSGQAAARADRHGVRRPGADLGRDQPRALQGGLDLVQVLGAVLVAMTADRTFRIAGPQLLRG